MYSLNSNISVSLKNHPRLNQMADWLENPPKGIPRVTVAADGHSSTLIVHNVCRSIAVASLLAVWAAAKEFATDGVFHNVKLNYLDTLADYPGIGEAMVAVGWAKYDKRRQRITLCGLQNEAKEGEVKKSPGAIRQQKYRRMQRLKKLMARSTMAVWGKHGPKYNPEITIVEFTYDENGAVSSYGSIIIDGVAMTVGVDTPQSISRHKWRSRQSVTIEGSSLTQDITQPVTLANSGVTRGVTHPVTLVDSGVTQSVTQPVTLSDSGVTQGVTQPVTLSDSGVTQGVTQPVTLANSGVTRGVTHPVTLVDSGVTQSVTQPVTLSDSGVTQGVTHPVTLVDSGVTQGVTQPVTLSDSGVTQGVTQPVTLANSGVTRGVTHPVTLVDSGVTQGVTQPVTLSDSGVTQGVTHPVTLVDSGVTQSVTQAITLADSGVTQGVTRHTLAHLACVIPSRARTRFSFLRSKTLRSKHKTTHIAREENFQPVDNFDLTSRIVLRPDRSNRSGLPPEGSSWPKIKTPHTGPDFDAMLNVTQSVTLWRNGFSATCVTRKPTMPPAQRSCTDHPVQPKKFRLGSSWRPSENFIPNAQYIGIQLDHEATDFEIAEFVDYWTEEGAEHTQKQWETKLARFIGKGRKRMPSKPPRRQDFTVVSNTDYAIPEGFHGG